jgi:replicative DNA helicase
MVRDLKINNISKVPPQDLDIEAAVLGSMMLEEDSIHKISSVINEDSFYLQSHQQIFKAIKRLSNTNSPIDLLTVTKSLRETKELEGIGGVMFVTGLTNNIVSAANIEHHARIIQQLYIQRELIKIGSETIAEAYDEGADIEDLISSAKRKISAIEDNSNGARTGQSHSDVFLRTILELEADCIEYAKGKQPGITTGFNSLNNATGGWRNTNLIILASRPAVGKTSLALHIAKTAARSGKWVNFYSLEMTATDLQRIMLAGETNINRTALRDGSLTEQDWDRINTASISFEKLPILWNDTAGLTAATIRANTIRNHKAGKCDLVIIDYLQLINPLDKRAIREQQISEISRTLKGIALSENIPVICLSQLNRAANDNEKPQLQHLRESGAIEQDADIAIFPYRSDGKYILSIGKNRRGKIGDIEIFANDQMTAFADSPPENFTRCNPNQHIEPDKGNPF